jgi:hypothetical protein
MIDIIALVIARYKCMFMEYVLENIPAVAIVLIYPEFIANRDPPNITA